MARITGNQGLIMNQSNNNSYMRVYSRGKNNVGPYLRFNISGGNPHLHIIVKTYMSFVQTNGSSDFNSALTIWNALWVDTGGNTYGFNAGSWTSGANIDRGWSTSFRQADLWFQSPSNGGWPGRASISSEIFCDRWEFVSISNP
jgi:hypothetical protein